MKKIISIITFTFLTIILFGALYPVVILGIAQFAPNQGKGETLTADDKVVGYQKLVKNSIKQPIFGDALLQ